MHCPLQLQLWDEFCPASRTHLDLEYASLLPTESQPVSQPGGLRHFWFQRLHLPHSEPRKHSPTTTQHHVHPGPPTQLMVMCRPGFQSLPLLLHPDHKLLKKDKIENMAWWRKINRHPVFMSKINWTRHANFAHKRDKFFYCLIQKIADLFLRNLYIDVSFPTSFSSQHAVARPSFAPSLSLMTTYSKEFITYVRKLFGVCYYSHVRWWVISWKSGQKVYLNDLEYVIVFY